MRSLADCVQEAERCERIAATIENAALRATFTEIAATWRTLANSTAARGPQLLAIMEIGAQRTRTGN